MWLPKFLYGSIVLAAEAASAAISLDSSHETRSAGGNPPTLAIQSGNFTSKWHEGSSSTQIVELAIQNTHTINYLTLADHLAITLTSDFVDFVSADKVYRISPGETIIVQVGVKNKAGVAQGTTGKANFTLTWGTAPITNSTVISGKCGFGNYTADSTSLSHHQTPDWFDKAKFGIFTHWGVYSAPAYGSVGANESYAEWYWHALNAGPTDKTQTYQYHNETYGSTFNYDDFFPNFTASKFDPKEWVDLFAAAGAQYIVPVTKHHDGFALFNISSDISTRTSVHYGPKRDLIRELLSAAKKYQPHLRRGTYFSLPEWYHPGYAKYPKGKFTGGPPVNPYTGVEIPYTGYVAVDDFVIDLQLPEMEMLAYDYETELLWCDIGGANNSTLFASAWLNWARTQNRQVTWNSRCGIHGDFATPEYTTYSGVVPAKWEASRGMDPHSYGYNYQSPDSSYLTGEDIVRTLVDMVSKNGNFLLDIGPRNDGSIPEIMSSGLLDAGSWIHAHSDSIFSTSYYAATPGLDPFRYTTKLDAFYIHVNSQPNTTTISVPDKIPYLPGDTVTVVGGSLNGTVVNVTLTDGLVTLAISDAIIAADKYVWTFKVSYTSTL